MQEFVIQHTLLVPQNAEQGLMPVNIPLRRWSGWLAGIHPWFFPLRIKINPFFIANHDAPWKTLLSLPGMQRSRNRQTIQKRFKMTFSDIFLCGIYSFFMNLSPFGITFNSLFYNCKSVQAGFSSSNSRNSKSSNFSAVLDILCLSHQNHRFGSV